MLYPSMTQSRLVFSLDGIWDFQLDDGLSAQEGWAERRLPHPRAMAVPSAYNDLYEGRDFREHVGNLCYQRTFEMPALLPGQRALLRFGSVTHQASVYVNGELVARHRGGFLPFEADVTGAARPGENLLTVLVNNVVDETTLPAGRMTTRRVEGLPDKAVDLPNFDFFNYSGIMRPVKLMVVPSVRITDVAIVAHADGRLSCRVETSGAGEISARVLDGEGRELAAFTGAAFEGRVEGVTPWSPEQPALYRLAVRLAGADGEDVYEEPFGFRDVTLENCRVCLNGKPVYLKGFGKHEDSPVNGRGFNEAYNVKDVALLKWLNANSFRTSHYPYSEEMLRLCDREGILVIAEAPAVGLHTGFSAVGLLGGEPNGTWKTMKTAEHHRDVIGEMIARDKNHPCVVMWSVANEPASEEEGAREYFEPLTNLARTLDPQRRPVTIVTYGGSTPETCKVAELCDVLVLNRYRGWYDTAGDLPAAAKLLEDELLGFHRRCPDKPIMLGEYGADTIAGLHDATPGLFSEEYQAAFLKAYGEVFDRLTFITGEHVWNFADFATAENIMRVGGNKKGVFTRERRPKLAAHFLRARWEKK